MKGLKIITLILLCVGLSNCKVKFNENGDVISVEDNGSFYVGDVDQIQHFNGGWYPAPGTPNYRVNLTMTVTKKGKIKAKLDTPECKVKGRLGVKVYSRLANMIEDAETKVMTSMRIDGGVNTVTLSKSDVEERFHLTDGDYTGKEDLVILEEDAKPILALLEKIASKLKEKYNCETTPIDTKIKTLTFKQRFLNYYKKPQAASAMMPPEKPPYGTGSVDRKFQITNDNGVFKVTGTEMIRHGGYGGFCHRELNNKELDIDLIKEMEMIKFTHSKMVCMMMPIGDNSTSFYVNYVDGSKEHGFEGCWNVDRVTNTQQFKDKFIKWLEQQPQSCAVPAAQ